MAYFGFTILLELNKVLYDEVGIGAVPDVDGGRAHPGEHLVERERNVLRKLLVEHPDLAVEGRLRHAVAVVVEQNSFVLNELIKQTKRRHINNQQTRKPVA